MRSIGEGGGTEAQRFNSKKRLRAERVRVIQASDSASRHLRVAITNIPHIYTCLCYSSQTICLRNELLCILGWEFSHFGMKTLAKIGLWDDIGVITQLAARCEGRNAKSNRNVR